MTLTIAECAARWQEANRRSSEVLGLQWEVAPTALEVYGTSGTAELADALDGSVDTVHNLAKAQRMFDYLYSWRPHLATEARSKFGYMRFAAMWRKHERYEIDPDDCTAYLHTDTSNDGMEALVESMYNPAPEWRRRFGNRQAVSWLQKIATEPDADQPLRVTRLARALSAAIERISK